MDCHQNLLDTLEALLMIFGELTALVADDQYLGLSEHSEEAPNNLTEELNDFGLLDLSLELFQLLK
jgi:hypothetical protein